MIPASRNKELRNTHILSLLICLSLCITGWPWAASSPSSVYHAFFLSLSFHSSFLSFLCLFFSAWSHLHSVFKRFRLFRANGHEVQIGVWSPDYSLQHLPHLGHWGLHLAPSLRPAGQTGQDQRLDCCYQQPVWVDTGGRRLARVAHWFYLMHSTHVKVLFFCLWPQVDLQSTKRITGIITQGAKDFGSVQFVTAFKVAHSDDGQLWTIVKDETTKTDKVGPTAQGNKMNLNVLLITE